MKKASSLQTPDRFSICIPFTLAQEEVDPANWSDPKNYSVDPVPTFAGIEQSEYWLWLRQHGLPQVSVKQITQSEGYAIYRQGYWLPYCPALPPGLDLEVFDTRVNQGAAEATRILQVALGIQNDGIWGPQTTHAVQAITDLPTVIKAFTARRTAVYKQTNGFGDYGKDWLRRASEIGAEALKMITTETS
jgi:lysozyme family protein